MSIEDIKNTFFAECADLLAELEDGLFQISSEGSDVEIVNAVFRAVHSIKGGAGAFGLDSIVGFAHIFENALDIIRNDLSALTADRVAILSEAADKLSDLVSAAQHDTPVEGVEPLQAKLAAEFNLDGGDEGAGPGDEIDFAPVAISLDDFGPAPEEKSQRYVISFKPHIDLFLRGHEPQRIFRELKDLGECIITCDTSSIPALDEFDSNNTYLSWTIELASECSEDDVDAIFNWVEGSCEYTIARDGAEDDDTATGGDIDVDAFLASLDCDPAIGGDDSDNPDILEATDAADADPAMEEAAEAAPVAVEPEEDAADQSGDPPKQDNASEQKNARADNDTKPAKTIRVESGKVDHLINLMGELVISQSMLAEKINESGFGAATPPVIALTELQTLTREIQSSVMSIRAQPIKPVFMRMSRVLREVCSITGKKASLELEGEFTEVDTTVIEGLLDPLTHMIRNAADHGVEAPDIRREKGKPENGTIRLSASHISGRISIMIADDGAGIQREKVFKKAVEKGIVAADAKLSDQEIDDLIMAPGFSTAEIISNVSGRGVGMDVVRQSIQSLGGRLSISSAPEQGSTFTMSLPLTLAILDGMLVRTADQVLVLPVEVVIETLKPQAHDLIPITNNDMCIRLRNNLVPVIDIGGELGFSERKTDLSECIAVVVEAANNMPFAFIVDAIEAQQQVVIKSLESNYRRIPAISAATILGNGQIALILDVDGLVSSSSQRHVPGDRQELVA